MPPPYPRDWTMKTTPEFATLKARLMGEIREDVRKAAMAQGSKAGEEHLPRIPLRFLSFGD